MFKRLLVGVAFLSLGAFGLQAQSSDTQSGMQPSSQQQSGSQISKTDRDFVTKAFQSNQKEIEQAQLASQRASSDEVKQFAQRLLDDHTKSNDQLKQIADSKGITLPSDQTTGQQPSRLSNLSGPEFDREFLNHQKQAHREAINLFRNQARNGSDPELKQFASTQLNDLQQHETMANSLHSKAGSASSSAQNRDMNQFGAQDQSRTGSTSSTSSSRSTESTTTTNQYQASNQQEPNQRLPRTASNMPLVGLFGLMLLGAAIVLRSFRMHRNNS